MAYMQVWPAGIEPHLQAQWLGLLQPFDELLARDDVGDAAIEDAVELLGRWLAGGH